MLTNQELNAMSLNELQKELEKARKEYLKTRIQVNTLHEKNTSKKNKLQKQVARIKTAIKQAEMEEAKKSSK